MSDPKLMCNLGLCPEFGIFSAEPLAEFTRGLTPLETQLILLLWIMLRWCGRLVKKRLGSVGGATYTYAAPY